MSRLHSRIYLHSLAVLVVVFVTTAALFVVGAGGAFRREVAGRLVRHLTSLVAEDFQDGPRLAGRLARLHDELDVDVTVRDRDGRLMAAAGAELEAPTAEALTTLSNGKVIVRGGPLWSAAAAIRDPASGAAVGSLHISTRHGFGFLHFLRPVVVVALVLLVVAVVTRPLARRISRPIERLTEGARRLGGGDLAYRVPTHEGKPRWWRRSRPSTDELEVLTRAFNDMADRVERLVRSQRELLANVSHELRSPLTRIRMALELLPHEGETAARRHGLEVDLADLDRLIENVLTTARLDATGLPTHLDAFDAQSLLAEFAERAGHDPLLAGVTVRLAPGPPVALIADRTLLRRAVWNLVENAAKYGAPPIVLAAEGTGHRVVLSITDDGPGIAAEDRARVFMPFVRGDSARTSRGIGDPPRGVGLGLTLARRVAEVHGGTIAVGPAVVVDGHERGCRVVVDLPAGGAA